MPLTGVMRTSSSLRPSIFLTMSARGSALAAGAGCALTGLAATPVCAWAAPTSETATRAANMCKDFNLMGDSYMGTFSTAHGRRSSRSAGARKSSREAGDPIYGRLLTARMVRAVQLFHALTGHVGVDLRGREVRMTQQHLHHAQVGSMIEQVRGEGVAQRVRRQLFVDDGLAGVALDDVPEGLARHAVATARREQVVGGAVEQDLAARRAHEVRQPTHGFLTQRDQTLAVALAHDPDDTLVGVDLVVLEIDQFRDAQAGGIQHLEHGAVAVTQRIGDHRSAEQ